MSYRNVVAFLVASGVLTASFLGCSASGTGADLGDSPAPTETGSTLPPPRPGTSSGDDGAPGDAGKGAKGHDASPPDAGPPPPEPGTPCSKVDQIYARSCGACGKQEAICQVGDPDGGTPKVSGYSACHDELAGGCTPGDSVTETCGNCGKHVKTCSKYCAWSVSACTGEPIDSCPAGLVSWTPAGCPTSGTFRSRACNDSCVWQGFAACGAPAYAVRVATAPGGTSRVVVPLTNAIHAKRPSGSCGSATLSATDAYAVAWVRIDNATAQNATLSVWNEAPPGSATVPTVLAAYASKPTTDAELTSCEKGVGDFCPASLPCGDPSFGALTGANAVVIPPGGSRVVGVTAAHALGTVGEVSEGTVAFVVRSDALN